MKVSTYNRKHFENIKNILDDAEVDADNFYGKGNKAAGKRLRAKMLEIGKLTTEVRKSVLPKASSKE